MTGTDSHRRAISTALASFRRIRRMAHSAEVAISNAAARYSAVTREAANWGDPNAGRHTRYVVPDDGRPTGGSGLVPAVRDPGDYQPRHAATKEVR